jgi:hypothetical protein
MMRVVDYCVASKEYGLVLKPMGKWDGSTDSEKIVITGVSDSDYAKHIETRRSMSGYSVFVNRAPVAMKSKMQELVTLSVTEAELVAATHCAQEMLYVKKVLESIRLKIQMPMKLMVDNKEAKDWINGWSVGSRTCHIDVCFLYLCELKEKNIAIVEWIRFNINQSDLFTKNVNEFFLPV